MSNKGYMQGSSGKLNPQSNITRGETVKILDNIIDNLLYENTEYGNISSENLCIINSKDAVISNSTFEGDVIVTAGAKALFKNSDIKGCLIALSPAKGSVKLENTGFGTLNAKNEYTVEIIETTNEEQTNDEPNKEQQTNENPQSPADSTETSPEGEFMPSISTTLQNGMVQKNSMKNFDVYALDASGAKIPCVVTFNTETIQPTWDDSEKTSYTLSFTQPGENTVVISATDNSGLTTEVSYTIIYEPAQYGEKIGEAVFCIEAFTVGGGYIITPVTVDVYEGVSAAYLLDQQLSSYGLGYNYSGSLDSGFYLFEINNIPDFAPIIPDIMTEMLSAYGYEVNDTIQKENALCEFDFTQGSGWMYCVNNLFPNVSISDYYPQDGDVIRILFTTAYGADVGGNNYAEYDPANDFFERTDRDALTRAIAQQGIENFTEYMDIITKPDITQEEIDSLIY